MAARGTRVGMGNYGNQVAPAVAAPEASPAAYVQKGPAQVGDALDHMANLAVAQQSQDTRELVAEAKEESRRIRIQAEADGREQRRVAAVRATTDYGNDVADLHQDLVTQLQTGKITADKLTEEFDARSGKLREQYSKDVAPELSGSVAVQLDNVYRDTRRRLAVDLEHQRRTQMVADFGATREGLERRALRDLPGAQAAYEVTAREVLRNAGFDEAKIAGDIQNFKERTTFTHLSTLTEKARDNPRALNQLRATLADPAQYDVLDPDKRRILTHTIDARMDTLRVRAEQAEAKRDRVIEREMNAVSRLSLQGVNPPPERLAALAGAVRGTAYEAEFKGYLSGLEDQRKFTALPPDRMAAELQNDIANVTRNGGTEADRLRIQRRQQTYELTVKQLTQDPLAFTARATGQEPAPLDFARPETLAGALRSRADTLLALNKTHGAALTVFRPDEALKVRQTLSSMDAEKRAGFLNTLRVAVGGGPVYNATLSQIAPDSPITALAGTYFGKADIHQARLFGPDVEIRAADVATRMLRGESILNPPGGQKQQDGKTRGFQVGKEENFATYFNNFAGNAFVGADRIRDTYYQAVKAVYADMAVQEGDYKGEVTESRVRKAFELVTGGGMVRFGRTDVVPPFGMTADTLTSAVYQQFGRLRDQGNTKLPPDFIRSAGLRQIDEGRYIVVAGGRPVPDEKSPGDPLVIDVTGRVPRETPRPTPRTARAPR